MKGKKRQHSAAFKAKVALEAIRENKTQAEITVLSQSEAICYSLVQWISDQFFVSSPYLRQSQ